MTRFVGEPSPLRKSVQGVWGVEDLRKRPAPEIEAGGPAPWVRRRYTQGGRPAGALTCGSLNDLNVSYNDTTAGVPDPTSAEVQGSDDWETYFALSSGTQFEVLQAGQYTLSGKIHWNSWSGNFGSYIILADGGSYEEIVSYVKPINEINSWNQAFTFTERYPANQTMLISVAQDAATSKLLDTAYFEIRYDGPYTGPDSNDPADPDPVE